MKWALNVADHLRLTVSRVQPTSHMHILHTFFLSPSLPTDPIIIGVEKCVRTFLATRQWIFNYRSTTGCQMNPTFRFSSVPSAALGEIN